MPEISKINFTTNEGHNYAIEFTEIDNLPSSITHKVYDVSIDLLNPNDVSQINSANTLTFFANQIQFFLNSNSNVILYYYCSHDDITINEKRNKTGISPQKYRHDLFQKMFERLNPSETSIMPMVFSNDNTDFYISLIFKDSNTECAKTLRYELEEIASK